MKPSLRHYDVNSVRDNYGLCPNLELERQDTDSQGSVPFESKIQVLRDR
jgi:hypothetical protein